jgi:integrase
MHVIDTDETVDVLETARGTRMLVPILLGVLCGLRRGEVVALRWRSVNLDGKEPQISIVASAEQTNDGVREKETKSGKGRAVALSSMLVSELRQHRKQQAEELLKLGLRLTDDHHVIAREDGEPIQPRSLSRHKLPQIRLSRPAPQPCDSSVSRRHPSEDRTGTPWALQRRHHARSLQPRPAGNAERCCRES